MRRLGRGEVETLVGWAAEEGWDPGSGDAAAFWAADPDAFVGFDRDGSLAGAGAVVSYGRSLGFVGLFILRPEFRGAGLGRELWQVMLEDLRGRLDPGAPIGLDAVAALQPFYAESGFVPAHDTRRIQLTHLGPAPDGLTPLAEVPFESLLELDSRCFGARREPFLRAWLEVGVGLAVVEHGSIEGYGVIRATRDGAKIGPLFAADAKVAEDLLRGLLAAMPDRAAVLDVPGANPEAAKLAGGYGDVEVFRTARMWLGEPPPIPWSLVFGMTTLELG